MARTTSLPVSNHIQHASSSSPLDRTTSTFTTAAETTSAIQRLAKSKIPLEAWNFKQLPRRKLRIKGLQEMPEEVDAVPEVEPLPGQLDRRIILSKQHRYRVENCRHRGRVDSEILRRRIPTAEELKHPFTEEVAEERAAQRPAENFEQVRKQFLQDHGHEVKGNLQKVFNAVHLSPAAVDPAVQKRFMESYHSTNSSLIPTYHGSNQKNYESICAQGLLIPGRGNDLRIQHGAAHGRGIYTARVEAPDLSRCFCSHPELLVCGVVDDALPSHMKRCGNHSISAQSNIIRHVGDAVVIFDQSRVVPLFRASGSEFRPWWQRPGKNATTQNAWLGSFAPGRGLANVNHVTKAQSIVDAGKGKIYHVPSKQSAFMPPQPLDADSHEINQKRIREKKLRDQQRAWDRQEKKYRLGTTSA